MKNMRHINPIQILAGVLLVLAIGCKKDESNEMKLSRMFSPATITGSNASTSVTLTWSAALFTTPGAASYTVDVSTDATNFSTIAYTTTTTNLTVTITDDKLAIRTDYFARVKAVGANGSGDSNYAVSTSFRILGEQFLNTPADADIIDNKVIMRWQNKPGLTKITFTPAGGTPFDVVLTPADLTAGQKTISGLTAGKNYTADLYADTKNKGSVTFVTKAALTGIVIDLRNINLTTRPYILTDTLPLIPSGAIVLLKKGASYPITSSPSHTFNFFQSVTIQSGLDFGSNLASIRMSTFFNIASSPANPTIDSLVFKDLIIKGGRFGSPASYDNDYILNASNPGTITKLHLENCNISNLRGVIRGQTASTGTKYTNYIVNNCVVDSIREFSLAVASNTSAFANIKVSNSTFARFRKWISHPVAGNSTITISNCTFNEVVAGGATAANGIIDLSTFNSTISITNCIFGATWNETGAGVLAFGIKAGGGSAINVTSSYNTSDFNNTAPAMSGLSSYSGTSISVFTDPANSKVSLLNFKVKDNGFPGKAVGDPRWK